MATISREVQRRKRHFRIRKKIRGTAARPRLSVNRSLKHIRVQLIDDDAGRTLAAASSLDKDFKAQDGLDGGNVSGARAVGKLIAERAKAKGIQAVVFDRGGYLFHGRVKELAEGAREAGLAF
jgi:large subunit ribosomal protein L18